MLNTTIKLGTDVAHLALFHPADLEHRKTAPGDWWDHGFALRRETEAGKLALWRTGFDGGFRLRLTTGDLTPEEKAAACESWSFPLQVRHGRLLVDGCDSLPSEDAGAPPPEEDPAWIDLPEGAYAAEVVPLDPGAGVLTRLPHYAVLFRPVADLGAVRPVAAPPVLRPFRDAAPHEPESAADETRFLWRGEALEGERFPALPLDPEARLLPGLSVLSPIDDEVFREIRPEAGGFLRDALSDLLCGADPAPGSLAVLSGVTGSMWSMGLGRKLTLQGRSLVRILALEPGEGRLAMARVAPVEPPPSGGTPEEARRLREALGAALRDPEGDLRKAAPRLKDFDLEWLAALDSPEAVGGWAVLHLPFPLARRLELYAAPFAERAAAVEALLTRA